MVDQNKHGTALVGRWMSPNKGERNKPELDFVHRYLQKDVRLNLLIAIIAILIPIRRILLVVTFLTRTDRRRQGPAERSVTCSIIPYLDESRRSDARHQRRESYVSR